MSRANQTPTTHPGFPIEANSIRVLSAVDGPQQVCEIAQPRGSSFLCFDESGSLLVTSSQDGNCLQVYSLPKGELKYTLERGYSPGTFVNVCFSPSRKLLAATVGDCY
jgi:WD40 repeat protein